MNVQGGTMQFTTDLSLKECSQHLLESESTNILILHDTEVETVLQGTQAYFEVCRVQKTKTFQRFTVMKMTGTLTTGESNLTHVTAQMKIGTMGYASMVLSSLVMVIGLVAAFYHASPVIWVLFLLLTGSLVYDGYVLQK